MESINIALIGIWLADPGARRSAQPRSSEATMMISTIQLLGPKKVCAIDARITPRITPMLRSTPRDSDWLTLGCTTSRAAIAAKMGRGCPRSAADTSQARTAAADVFRTWVRGARDVTRKFPGTRTAS